MDDKIREALEAVVPCLEDWIKSTGFGFVHKRDSAALALVKDVLTVYSNKEKCTWTQDEPDAGHFWDTMCGKNFYFENKDDTPCRLAMKFCPFCGKEIEEVKYEKELDV